MKVSFITRHAISNYGSLLQTIATQAVLQKLGYDSEVVDYIRRDEEYKSIAKLLLQKNDKWNTSPFKKLVYLAIQSPEYYISGKKFEAFRKKHLILSPRYTSLTELKQNPPEADIYLTGSDQVWGPIGSDSFDKAYFMDFLPQGRKAVAYAGSFGKTAFSADTLEQYKSMLSKYDTLTVREQSAVQLLQKMGFQGAIQVLDPTLLITADEWSKLITENIHKNYVLIYQLHSNPEMCAYAKTFAEKVNLPLIRITPTLHQILQGGKPKYLPAVSGFLGYIKNAAYMITDSFHGTAFAINFNTQFVTVVPHETGTRNQSILELTGLTDRILKDYNDFHFIQQKINYTPVNTAVEKARKKSVQVLKEMLQNASCKKPHEVQ